MNDFLNYINGNDFEKNNPMTLFSSLAKAADRTRKPYYSVLSARRLPHRRVTFLSRTSVQISNKNRSGTHGEHLVLILCPTWSRLFRGSEQVRQTEEAAVPGSQTRSL